MGGGALVLVEHLPPVLQSCLRSTDGVDSQLLNLSSLYRQKSKPVYHATRGAVAHTLLVAEEDAEARLARLSDLWTSRWQLWCCEIR